MSLPDIPAVPSSGVKACPSFYLPVVSHFPWWSRKNGFSLLSFYSPFCSCSAYQTFPLQLILIWGIFPGISGALEISASCSNKITTCHSYNRCIHHARFTSRSTSNSTASKPEQKKCPRILFSHKTLSGSFQDSKRDRATASTLPVSRATSFWN